MGLVTDPHARTPPQPEPVGSGPRQPTQRAGSWGWESARRRTPHTQARGTPPGTLMPPPQRARARAVGLVTGPHARNPPHLQPVGSGLRQPAQRAGSWGWESAQPRTPHTQARGVPPGHPHAAPTARKSARCGVGDGSSRPHPQPVGSGPRQPAQRAGSWGSESARPWTPQTEAGGAPPGRPRAAPPARKASTQQRALWGW